MAGEGGTQEVKITPIELGRYDKIREVYIAYRDNKIQGIAFGVTDAIGSRKITSYGIKHYNYAMMLKPNEYIMKLSGTYTVNEEGTQSTIVSLKIHTNLCPNGLPKSDDDDDGDRIFNPPKDVKTASFPVELSETDIIVQVFLTAYQDANKKGTGYESFLLSSIGLEVEEVVYSDMKYGLPAKYVDRKKWSLKLGKCEYIKEIIINYGDVVNGIGFVKVDAFGRRQPLEWFGEYGGETYRMVLKPNEYIARISGTYKKNYGGEEVIAALRIYSNKWLSGYKLCGSEPGEEFSTPLLTTDCIQEIYGSCGRNHLTSLAISAKECVVKDGPFGTQKPDNEWSIEVGASENITKISLIFGALLNSIEITTSTTSTVGGVEDVTQKAGGSGGDTTKPITIPFKDGEYVTKIKGTLGTWQAEPGRGDVRGVATLAIHTTLNPAGYGPYGVARTNTGEYTDFETSLPSDARIVRFFGTIVEGQVIQSIGVIFSQKDEAHGNYQILKEWCIPSDNITEMIVKAGDIVNSLETITRTLTGREAKTVPHKVGGDGGNINKIEFKKEEYITKISGATGTWKREINEGGDVRVVARLAIHTNLKPEGYGPYGGDGQNTSDYKDFSSIVLSNNVRVVRFFGTIFEDKYIQSIGVFFNQKVLRRETIGINTHAPTRNVLNS